MEAILLKLATKIIFICFIFNNTNYLIGINIRVYLKIELKENKTFYIDIDSPISIINKYILKYYFLLVKAFEIP